MVTSHLRRTDLVGEFDFYEKYSDVKGVAKAIGRYGAPEIVNTDQGSQFTSYDTVSDSRAGIGKYFDLYK